MVCLGSRARAICLGQIQLRMRCRIYSLLLSELDVDYDWKIHVIPRIKSFLWSSY